MSNKVTLSVDVVNAILNYLASKPYQEVFQLIQALQQDASKNNEEKSED